VAYLNFLLKVTRAMTPFTTHPYQSIMTVFMGMIIKETDSSWSFHTPGLGSTSAQLCYTTSLFLSFTDPGIALYSWYVIKCMWSEKSAYLPPLSKQPENSQVNIYNMSFYPKVQYFNNTNIYIPRTRSCAAN